jgi:elongation factor P
MAGLIEAIDIKRRTFFESEGVPFTAIDVDISRPTARGGQTLVRIKMRNLITRAVFDRTYKAGEKFQEPDLEMVPASYLYGGNDGYNFMDQNTYDTLTLGEDMIGDDRQLLVENQLVQIQKFNGRPIGVSLPQHVELSVASTEPAVRGDTASGGATKIAVLETGLSVRVPLFIEEGERVRVHTETREFVGRA